MLQYLWRLLGRGDAAAVPADKENSNQIHVTIRTFDGKSHLMDIDTADTVFNVITIMSKQIERKPEDLMMVFDVQSSLVILNCSYNVIPVQSSLVILNCSYNSSSFINKQTEFPLFTVKIRFNGRDREMDVNPRHYVWQVKREICQETDKEAKKMLLLFEAPQTTNCSSGDPCQNSDVIVLDERKKIEEYDIKQGSVIRLVWKTDWETK
ncbi:UNVERIFIED_CONTAM: hypothetical protein FKN15_025073 [Acipenser sinensis]